MKLPLFHVILQKTPLKFGFLVPFVCTGVALSFCWDCCSDFAKLICFSLDRICKLDESKKLCSVFSTNGGMRISEFDFATLDVGTHEDCCPSSLFWQSLVDLKQFLNTKIQARSGNFRSRNSKMTTFFHQNFVTTGWSVFLYTHISQFPYGWLFLDSELVLSFPKTPHLRNRNTWTQQTAASHDRGSKGTQPIWKSLKSKLPVL